MRLSADLRQELALARSQTDLLFDLLDPAALYDRPISERNRIIFYLGHLEAFDWNHLARRCLDLPSFHPSFDNLFERGIDPEPGQLPSDVPKDWPQVPEVRLYNNRVREKVDRFWEETPLERRQMVIEHRQMHAETFAYMLHNVEPEKKRRQPQPDVAQTATPNAEMIHIPAGFATLGQPRGAEFGWDNEFEEQRIFVPAFRIMRFKVTNRQYLDFVREGGTPSHFWVGRITGRRRAMDVSRDVWHGNFTAGRSGLRDARPGAGLCALEGIIAPRRGPVSSRGVRQSGRRGGFAAPRQCRFSVLGSR